MADVASQLPAKPGTACLGCRRRKLKCSREQTGCANCAKSDLPCVYPTPETNGVKRKRGPYKKDKAPRERHLEHLVKYLEPRSLDGEDGSSAAPENLGGLDGGHVAAGTAILGRGGAGLSGTLTVRNGHSEDLVKDALIALTKSSVSERESTTDSTGVLADARPGQSLAGIAGTSSGLHPPLAQVFEYWHLFVARVDPLTKVIHCPTFAKQLFPSASNYFSPGSADETLLFSIYYVVVSTCTANEARRRFGESRDVLLQRYGRVIEATLANNYGMPALESVQALVLYITGVRRQDDGSNVTALFGLAVRMAQLMGLHEDPGSSYSPFEAEYRRRLWWHLCGLESRGAEESGTRSTSIMEGQNVQFPANVNDYDLNPNAKEPPQSRIGISDTTFVRLRWEVHRMVHRIWSAKRENASEQRDMTVILAEQRRLLEETQERLEVEYTQYFHKSRPYDWLCMSFYEGMLVKTRMVIDYPFGQVPTKDMGRQERFQLLQSSVVIISITHLLAVDTRIDDWRWFFAGWVQWHSLAIVVAELGRSTNRQFTRSAWAVLDPILVDWDRLYRSKKGEPAWDHVNTLIARAKQMRCQAEKSTTPGSRSIEPATVPTGAAPRANHYSTAAVPSSAQYIAPTVDFGSPLAAELQQRGSSLAPHQAPTPHSMDEGVVGQAQAQLSGPGMWDLDPELASFESIDEIDFEAFDAVFGGEGWQFPSPMADLGGIEMSQGLDLQGDLSNALSVQA